jgi:predicted O-linked N-acetylglucosamine transferase (SPINDLY family)
MQAVQRGLDFHRQGRLVEAERNYAWVLAREAGHFDALHLLGLVRVQQGNPAAALDLMSRALRIRPNAMEVLANLNGVLMALNRHQEALANLNKMIAAHPADVNALFNRGVALAAMGRGEEALASYDQALKIRPDMLNALYNRATVLASLERFSEALTSYETVLSIGPRHVEALTNRANVLAKLKRLDEALESYDHVLAIEPRHLDALANCGAMLKLVGRPGDALACFERALAINPGHLNSLVNRGNALLELDHPQEALHSYEKAIAIDPVNVDAFIGRGNALFGLNRDSEALASHARALAIAPHNVDAALGCGVGLFRCNRFDEALANYERALAAHPRNVDLHNSRGIVLAKMRRFGMAVASFRAALAIDPGDPAALGALANCLAETCDWAELEGLLAKITGLIAEGKPFDPLYYVRLTSDPAAQLTCARNFVRGKLPALPGPLWKRAGERSDRIRIAYLSPDFRNHPVAFLVARLFELHDRARFETLAISTGPDDCSEIRSRIERGVDRFHDVRLRSDRETAELINDLQVHIVIDLAGHTEYERPRLLSMRAAPIQVGYLGYCSTVGADYLDYIIADRIVLPFDRQSCYTEKIIHLPDCFMVNDATQAISPDLPARGGAGLPEHGVVFCCFNASYKFRPQFFDLWMRLLRAVDGSVLWLPALNPVATENLRKEAAHWGVDPLRIVFAPRLELREDHFARCRLADLFLDTLPYNAHSTACDSLYAGVPVLTCKGNTFAGTAAASLLHAVGLPELVTNSLDEYEALALRLAANPQEMRQVRRKLAENLPTCPLFDTDRFRRHIEAAYATMWDLHQRRESPRSFSVAVIGTDA